MCYNYSSTFYLNMFLAVLGVDLLQFLRFISDIKIPQLYTDRNRIILNIYHTNCRIMLKKRRFWLRFIYLLIDCVHMFQ